MTIELSGALGAVVAVAAVSALLASAVAFFRVNLSKATIEAQKQNIEALSGRVTILERTDVEKTAQITKLEAENATLRSLVGAEKAIENLAKQLSESTTAILAAVQSKRAGAEEAEARGLVQP